MLSDNVLKMERMIEESHSLKIKNKEPIEEMQPSNNPEDAIGHPSNASNDTIIKFYVIFLNTCIKSDCGFGREAS